MIFLLRPIAKSYFTPLFVLLTAVVLPSRLPAETLSKPPNVLFILVDDLGWSDLGCYGSDYYRTPNVDRLARQGLKFQTAYAAAPVCSPTRAALLTGKSPARLGMTIWHEGAVRGGPPDRKLREPSSLANLPREEWTLAERFRAAGYRTAHIGKWHLGTAAYYPETQGFDVHIGGTFWGAPATYFHPFSGRWSDRDSEIRYVPGLGESRPGDYLTDELTDQAIDFIKSSQQPFFLNLWYYTVHSPIEAPKELVDACRQRPIGKHHRDATYAAMVQRMDENVGRLLQTLADEKIRDHTVVVLTSDNGGVDFEQRSIVPTSNAPLRSGKGTLYEGGIRVPLLIDWPKMPAGTTSVPCISQDFVPTFAPLLGWDDGGRGIDGADAANATANAPNSAGDDGLSLMPVITDPSQGLTHRPLFWHFPHYYPRMTPASAIRDGDWKLIHYYEDDQRELYDLRIDPGEQRDVANAYPEHVARLSESLDRWRREVDANEPTDQTGE